MSVSDDIWQDIQFGKLERFCRDGYFPTKQTFVIVFWNQYVSDGNAEWDDFRTALEVLVKQGHLKNSPNGWYTF